MKGLKARLKALGMSYAELGFAVGISKQQVAHIANHNVWPKSMDRKRLREAITEVLDRKDLNQDLLLANGEEPSKEKPPAVAPAEGRVPSTVETEGEDMLLRKQPLTQETKKHFALFSNPWDGEVTSDEEMFLTPDMRYVREAMWHAARNAGLLAVIGESGAGKTTLKEALLERIEREGKPIHVIQPSVLGLEDNDTRGKTLKAGSVADAAILTVDPHAKPPGSMEAKSRMLQRTLEESRKAGFLHLMLIEEAHCLSMTMIKHLKRFHELKAGRTRLLSIVLIGQPELRSKLSESNFEVREFVQRCEIVTLEPLDKQLADYLAFRAKRVDRDLAEFIDTPGIEALRARLSIGRPGEKGFRSLLYPLAVNNMMTAAMNHAADLGAPKINADIVRGL
ncbi:AAA family ATPase [Arenimonas sp.]|uniref:ExeA family protein n=1 Tax=Arenimonas sp. TaxID=1872635 RepID=UPI0025C70E75|nr:AAA family ATPase [Arenimonas sp.]